MSIDLNIPAIGSINWGGDVNENWQTIEEALNGLTNQSINFLIDGGGSEISTGTKGYVRVPFNCTITGVTLLSDVTGSIVIDIHKSTYNNFPSNSSICASALPALSSARKSENTTLTGWTTSITAGDVLQFDVDSISSITKCTLALAVTRT